MRYASDASRDAPAGHLILYGEERAERNVVSIGVGELSLTVVDGSVEDVAVRGDVIFGAIQFVFRDRYWRRVEPRLESFERSSEGDRFRARWTLRFVARECDVNVAQTLEVTATGITVSAEAVALAPTVTNRAGFILLHPAETTAGRPVAVTHSDGEVTNERFPDALSPHAVLSDMVALALVSTGGTRVSVTLSGDVFETEDQRNWTDASFKTFSRPLSEPIPYEIEPSSPVRQTVSIRFGQDSHSAANHKDIAVVVDRPPETPRSPRRAAAFVRPTGESAMVHVKVTAGETGALMPSLGFGVHHARANADDALVGLLGDLHPSVLQLTLNPADVAEGVSAFTKLATSTGADAALELTVPFEGGEQQLGRIVGSILDAGLPAPRLTLYPETDAQLEAARAAFPGCEIGGGTPFFFVLAHRAQLPRDLDYIQWTMPPGVHDISDRAVMETLGCVPLVLDRAHELWPGKPLCIGPNSIRPRFRPTTANRHVPPLDRAGRPDDVDPRQRGLFAAAWALGFIARLAYGGAERILMFEPFGERGLAELETSGEGNASRGVTTVLRFPVYAVLRALAGARGCNLVPLEIDREDLVLGLSWSSSEIGAMFANLAPRPLQLRIEGIADFSVRSVSGRRSAEISGDTVLMDPFETIAIGDARAS